MKKERQIQLRNLLDEFDKKNMMTYDELIGKKYCQKDINELKHYGMIFEYLPKKYKRIWD